MGRAVQVGPRIPPVGGSCYGAARSLRLPAARALRGCQGSLSVRFPLLARFRVACWDGSCESLGSWALAFLVGRCSSASASLLFPSVRRFISNRLLPSGCLLGLGCLSPITMFCCSRLVLRPSVRWLFLPLTLLLQRLLYCSFWPRRVGCVLSPLSLSFALCRRDASFMVPPLLRPAPYVQWSLPRFRSLSA